MKLSPAPSTAVPQSRYARAAKFAVGLVLALAGTAVASHSAEAGPAALTVASIQAVPSEGPMPLSTEFSGDVVGGEGPLEYRWTFGDGLWSTQPAPTHEYGWLGEYNVQLDVSDGGKTVKRASTMVRVTAPELKVTGLATPDTAVAGASFDFSSRLEGGIPPFRFLWSFENASFSYEPNASRRFLGPGVFSVELTVVDWIGEWRMASVNVTVTPGPMTAYLSLERSGDVAPLQVLFSAAAAGGMPPYRFGWSFGDGTGGERARDTHAYRRGGSYLVVLTVTDARGTEARQMAMVEAFDELRVRPRASFGEGGAPLEVWFVVAAAGGSGEYTFAWRFGDGTGAAGQTVIHSFEFPGNYTVSVEARDSLGHNGSAEIRLVVPGIERRSGSSDTQWPAHPAVAAGPSAGAAATAGVIATLLSGGAAGLLVVRRRVRL